MRKVPIMMTIEQYKVCDLEFVGTTEGNPYADVTVSATFTREDGTDQVVVGGFYRGGGSYGIRFMPRSTGVWNFSVESNDPLLSGTSGSIEVTPATAGNHGRVLRTTDVRSGDAFGASGESFTFSYEDGTPFLPFGTTCYAWTNQPEAVQERTLETLAASPFNKVRMCVFPKFYDYNLADPELYAYQGEPEHFDHERFNEPFWANLDRRIEQLDDLGIQADVILLHPYDKEKWGFSKMTKAQDIFYLTYVARRYSAYKNVWWSLANEYDLLPAKTLEDWDQYARVIMANDPYGHLRSIHNCITIFDYSRPWCTHCSLQRVDLYRTAECVTEWREDYGKPVVVDECAYEGNINWGWGNITGEEMTRRFWEGCLRGGYLTHGETFVDKGPQIWWAHGGELHGESPERIAFCRKFLEEGPADLGPLAHTPENHAATWDLTVAADGFGTGTDYQLLYFGFFRPSYRELDLPVGKRYQIDVVDTWNMTIDTLPGTFEGHVRVDLPGKQYVLIRLRAA